MYGYGLNNAYLPYRFAERLAEKVLALQVDKDNQLIIQNYFPHELGDGSLILFFAHYDSNIEYVPAVGDFITIIMDTTNLGGKEPRVIKISRQ
jgi:hypothetical protein